MFATLCCVEVPKWSNEDKLAAIEGKNRGHDQGVTTLVAGVLFSGVGDSCTWWSTPSWLVTENKGALGRGEAEKGGRSCDMHVDLDVDERPLAYRPPLVLLS